MKRAATDRILLCLLLLAPCVLSAQTPAPMWLDADVRSMEYSAEQYYTGFTVVVVSKNKNLQTATAEAKQSAVGDLSNRIVASVSSSKQHTKTSTEDRKYGERVLSEFSSDVAVKSQVDVAGSHVETYYDRQSGEVYAFAYVNKMELIGYYKANLSLLYQQAESAWTAAQDLEAAGENAKARTRCEETMPLLEKIRVAQDVLTAIDITANAATLKAAQTEQMYNSMRQMLARLSQATAVFVDNHETMFSQKTDIVANKLKNELSQQGCSFVDNATDADFVLKLKATARESSTIDGMIFYYADVVVELFDRKKQKNVYTNEFSVKAGSTTRDKAARGAMTNAAEQILQEVKKWIE